MSAAGQPLSETDRFVAAFDQSVMGLAITDLDGAVLHANEAFCRIVGRPLGELLGRTSQAYTHPEDRAENTQAIRQLREAKVPSITYQKRYLRPNGEPVWTRIGLSLVRQPGGEGDHLIATIEDISEQKHIRSALEESEERLRLIFASITDYAIFTINLEGKVTTWNSGAERIFGHTAAEMIGRPSTVLWLPEDLEHRVPERERQLAREQGFAPEERWHPRRDGTRFWASGVMRPMLDSKGEVRGFSKIWRDVTAQRQAEQEIAEARLRMAMAQEAERNRLTEVFQRSPSFMAVLRGPEHHFEMANERYYQLVGHRELLHRTVREALPEVEGQGIFEVLDQVYRTGQPYVGRELSLLLQRQPGAVPEKCVLDLVYQPLRDGAGAVSGILAHGVDITERILAQEEKEQQTRTLEVLLSGLQDQVVIFSRAGLCTFANPALLHFLGLGSQQVVGRLLRELNYPPEVEARMSAGIASVFAQKQATLTEVTYRAPDGATGSYEYLLSPLRGAGGEVEQVAAIGRDVSARKRVEEERELLLASERRARTEAERNSRMKDEFLASLSHELRTPLNAVVGWATILRDDPTPEDLVTGIEIIERNARAQARIIEDLLDMSRIVSGKVRLEVQPLDLAPIVQAALETLRPTAQARGVRLQSVLDPNSSPVSGDPNRLQQVFWNLLSNAVKFTPKGGRVQVVLQRTGSQVELSITDSGEGISPEFLPHVFDRFRQADASITRRHGGLGLGLAIVKQLTELHGGTVEAYSAGEGSGATFTVRLPLTVLRGEAKGDPEQRHPRSSEEPLPLSAVAALSLQGVKVLVLDDEPDARALVARLLQGVEAMVQTAGTTEEALTLLQTGRPDVLISDIGMPGEDGYSFIRRVRALGRERGGEVPAIALTAYARAEDRVKALLAGFQMHVAKPVEGVELLTMVASITGRAGR